MGFLSNSIVKVRIEAEERNVSLRDILKLIEIRRVRIGRRNLSSGKVVKYYAIDEFVPRIYVLCEKNKFLRIKEIHYYFYFGKVFEVRKESCLVFDEFTEIGEKLNKRITFSPEKELFVGLIVEGNSFYYVNGILARHI